MPKRPLAWLATVVALSALVPGGTSMATTGTSGERADFAGARSGPPVPLPDRPKGLPPQADWGGQIEPLAGYRPQLACAAAPLPGLAALRSLALATYENGSDGGTIRSCASGGQSEHKEGRAWDWMLDVHDAADRRTAGHFLSWLLRPDAQGRPAAMARRLGVMYVIYNRKIWAAYSPGWRDYTGSDPHTSHIHISLSWNGARGNTSFWRGKVPPLDYGTCTFFAGQPAVAATSTARTIACPAPATSPRGSSRPFGWLGSTGESIRIGQRRLGVPATGTLDTSTRQRLLEYQLSHDLPRTGALDDPTWASLDPATRTQSVPHWTKAEAVEWAINAGSPQLHRSSAGKAVYALQVALELPVGLRTGFLGQRTGRAVVTFRDEHGLAATIRVAARVWRLLTR